jgi:hypothetical protein
MVVVPMREDDNLDGGAYVNPKFRKILQRNRDTRRAGDTGIDDHPIARTQMDNHALADARSE